MRHRLIITLFLGLTFLSCKDKEITPKSSFKEVYQLSEMALLMENMYSELEKIRPEVIEGKEVGDFPVEFNKIHTAQMTPSFEKTEEFRRFSDLLLQNQKAFYDSRPDSMRIQLYNNMVKTCISCHKSDAGCIGPVSKIGKLIINN